MTSEKEAREVAHNYYNILLLVAPVATEIESAESSPVCPTPAVCHIARARRYEYHIVAVESRVVWLGTDFDERKTKGPHLRAFCVKGFTDEMNSAISLFISWLLYTKRDKDIFEYPQAQANPALTALIHGMGGIEDFM